MYLTRETAPVNNLHNAGSDIYLEAGHICIKKNIAEQIFGAEKIALTAFYTKDHTFLIAPPSEEPFRMLHKVGQSILKMKNATGDVSISIRELLLDNEEIDNNDRDLEYVTENAMHLIKIKL
jgi:hypothetical protein